MDVRMIPVQPGGSVVGESETVLERAAGIDKCPDFSNLRLDVLRSIYMRHIGDCKTEASRKPVPLDERVAADLWRRAGIGSSSSSSEFDTQMLAPSKAMPFGKLPTAKPSHRSTSRNRSRRVRVLY